MQRDGELSVEMIGEIIAVPGIQVEDDFRVGRGGEDMALPRQLRSQFDVVEDLAVEDQLQATVGAAHRLPAAFQVDDGKAGVGQAHAAIDPHAATVRAPVLQCPDHRFQHPGRRRG